MKEDPHTGLVATGKAAVTAIKAEIIERTDTVFILKPKISVFQLLMTGMQI